MMHVIPDDTVKRVLTWDRLIPALRSAFASMETLPERTHLPTPNGTLLLMPAWQDGSDIGVKIATVHPGNVASGLPAVHALYVLLDGKTGAHRAVMQARALTAQRTAATSALASSYLSRPDASTLLMVGAGALAIPLIEAHASVRPIRNVLLWNRTRTRAEQALNRLDLPGVTCTVVDRLDEAIHRADIISTATLSRTPLVEAAHVQPGTHVDLVGAYRADMQEADADLMTGAAVFVDTREGALAEAGDLVVPISEGRFGPDHVRACLKDLCSGSHPGRTDAKEITVFKSVGHALEDLVAARMVARALA